MRRIALTTVLMLSSFHVHAQTPVVRGWPGSAPWHVMLVQNPGMSPVCAAMTETVASGNARLTVSFAMADTSTGFYLVMQSPYRFTNQPVDLFADDAPILLGLAGVAVAGGPNTIRAELPGAVLAQRIIPALERANTLKIRIGTTVWAVPTPLFTRVQDDLVKCARTVHPER